MLATMIRKELRQHGVLFVSTFSLGVVVPYAMVEIDRKYNAGGTLLTRAITDMASALAISYVSPTIIAYALMASERTKRTLLALRLLPITSHIVITGKELTGLMVLFFLMATNCASFFFSFRWMIGPFPFQVHLLALLNAFFCLVLLMEVSLWMFLTFAQKWATQLPFLAAGLIYPLILVLQHTALGANQLRWAAYAMSPVCLALSVLAGLAMRAEFDRQDWALPSSD